jgi:hypothetical protein
LKLNIAGSPLEKGISTRTWRYCFPPDALHSRLLIEPSHPHEWELLLLHQPLESFNIFISGPDFAITGFSAQMAGGSYEAVGVTDESVLILAFRITHGCPDSQSSITLRAAGSSTTNRIILEVRHCNLNWETC